MDVRQLVMKVRPSIYEAKPGANTRTFWMSYAIEIKEDGKVKLEGIRPMSIREARAFMHKIVDNGADDLIRRFGAR